MFQPSVHDFDLLRIKLILEEEERREKKPLLQRIAGFFGMRPKNMSQAHAHAQAQAQAQAHAHAHAVNTSKYQPRPGLNNTAHILHRRQARSAR